MSTEKRLRQDLMDAIEMRDAYIEACGNLWSLLDLAKVRIAELEAQLAKANDWSHIAPVAASPSRFTERFCTIFIPGRSCSCEPGHIGPCAATPDPDKPA